MIIQDGRGVIQPFRDRSLGKHIGSLDPKPFFGNEGLGFSSVACAPPLACTQTPSHRPHSQLFVCKLINAATASTEEQLLAGVWLAERDAQVLLLLWSVCRMPDRHNGVSMCFSVVMPQVEKKKSLDPPKSFHRLKSAQFGGV